MRARTGRRGHAERSLPRRHTSPRYHAGDAGVCPSSKGRCGASNTPRLLRRFPRSSRRCWRNVPGSMGPCREIYQEGLRIPPVKIMRGGKMVADVLALLLNNVRTPEEREGDLGAQIAACQTGAQRLREICDALRNRPRPKSRCRSARLFRRNDARLSAHHPARPLPGRRFSRRRWRRRQTGTHRRDDQVIALPP
jgi:hypothetical protein